MTTRISPAGKIKAGIIQFDVFHGDFAANWSTVSTALDALANQGASIAVLPEMWTCGFDLANLREHASQTPEIIKKLSDRATANQMIIIGSMPEAGPDGIYNTAYVVDETGRTACAYRKIHLFTPTREDAYFVAGDRAAVCRSAIGPVGPLICYDLRFPELPRALALKGAWFVIVCAQWPLVRIRHWDILLQARAIENQVFILAANRCGADPGLAYGGRSAIISPTGNVLAQADHQPALLIAECNPSEMHDFRRQIPCVRERRPDIYENAAFGFCSGQRSSDSQSDL